MHFLIAIIFLLPGAVYATNPNCSAALETPAETKQVIDEFVKFYQNLPEELRIQVDSFCPMTGWLSEEEMQKDIANGIGPKQTFLISLHVQPDNEINFQVDPSIRKPEIRDGKVLLPQYLGKRLVQIGVLTLH